MKRILLFGSIGQIGGELQPLLRTMGEVVAPAPEEADFRQPESLREVVRRERPDAIVNAAAYTNVDGAEREPALSFAINAEAPRVLAEAAAGQGAIFIHYSTDYVFDGRSSRPYREDDPTGPLNAYGRDKLAGERGVLASGGRAVVLRTSWIYGMRGQNFLLTVRRLAGEGKPLRIVSDQVGAPTWCRSVAEGTAEVLRQAMAGPVSEWGLFHMTCGGVTNWCEFARAFLPAGTPVEAIRTEEFPRPAARPGYSVLDNAKLSRVFGVRLASWEAALRACLATER